MADTVCSIPSVELDEQLTVLLLETHNQKISKVDKQKIKISCLLLVFQTSCPQDQNPVH